MGQLLKILKPTIWLLLMGALAIPSASAQSGRYPPADDPWDGTSYRALVQRHETEGLPLPTLSDPATKPVFERMTNVDNIPLRVGLNQTLSATIRFQRLDGALHPIRTLVALYLNETQKGKPLRQELARMMIYESKVSAALLDVSDAYMATLQKDKRYQVHVDYLDQVKSGARQLYFSLVQGMTEQHLYSKSDSLDIIAVALVGLPSYQPILKEPDRQALLQTLTQQISTTTDQELKTALSRLRDGIAHRRPRTED
jgi:hypothetical protein